MDEDINFDPTLFPEKSIDYNSLGARLLKGLEKSQYYSAFVDTINKFPKDTPVDSIIVGEDSGSGELKSHVKYIKDDGGKKNTRITINKTKNPLLDKFALGHEMSHVATKGKTKEVDLKVENSSEEYAYAYSNYAKKELLASALSHNLLSDSNMNYESAYSLAMKIVNSLTDQEATTLAYEYFSKYKEIRNKPNAKPASYFEPKFWRQGDPPSQQQQQRSVIETIGSMFGLENKK